MIKKLFAAGGPFMIAIFFLLGPFQAKAQTEFLSPNDTIRLYNPVAPVSQPDWGEICKWVVTPTVKDWNTSDYKSYIYNGLPFRLLWPKNYKADSSSKTLYPVVIHLHGYGERADISNNDIQLRYSGKYYKRLKDEGKFNGFVIFPSSLYGWWGDQELAKINFIVRHLIYNQRADPDRIIIEGLSTGGIGVWNFIKQYPQLIAGAMPLSAVDDNVGRNPSSFREIPVWLAGGALDYKPSPQVDAAMVSAVKSGGVNAILTIYPKVGHNILVQHYADKNLLDFILKSNKLNPYAVKTRFGSNERVATELSLTAGFDDYEWEKNGKVIPGEHQNKLYVTDVGSYRARIKHYGDWSPWSPEALVLKRSSR